MEKQIREGAFHHVEQGRTNQCFIHNMETLVDRLPTKINMEKRHLILLTSDIKCSLCGEEPELVDHLFMRLLIAIEFLRGYYSWLGISLALLNQVTNHFLMHSGFLARMYKNINLYLRM